MGMKKRKVYLWLEDRKGKSGYVFWKTMMSQIAPEVIVESKKNNSELVKAVKQLKDEENHYVIVFDNSFDNLQVCQEQKLLRNYVKMKHNVEMMEFICFEYILLEFDQLISWIYAPEDEFLRMRMAAIEARKKLLSTLKSGNMHYKVFQEIMQYDPYLEEHNIEQLAARLLFDLTRNTGFEVSKKRIGECWVKSCCLWENRREDDVCGLDRHPLALAEKMECIYRGTSLHDELKKIGLEVML